MKFATRSTTSWIIWILLLSVVIIFGQSLYQNLYSKSFTFQVEMACNSETSECYSRMCQNDGDCPPNNLTTYRVFTLPASEFQKCSDNSCSNICSSEHNNCTEVLCSTQTDISCIGPTGTSTQP